VTDEGEIAAVLGRMLDHAGRMDVQAVGQVCAASSHQLGPCNNVTAQKCNIGAGQDVRPCRPYGCTSCWSGMCSFFLPTSIMQPCYRASMHHQCTVPVAMQVAWMFRLLVRYVQLLYTNVEHASLPQRTRKQHQCIVPVAVSRICALAVQQ